MVDWKTKLTSRKFWAAVAQFITMLIIAFNGTQETATQVTALIMAGAAVVAYIIGEGLIDAAGAGSDVTVTHVDDDSTDEKIKAIDRAAIVLEKLANTGDDGK